MGIIFNFCIYIAVPSIFFYKNTKFALTCFKKFLESSGPIFIKFGQTLSTRPDIIGYDNIDILYDLLDNTKPAKRSHILKILKSEGLEHIELPLKPVASASIAQIYKINIHNKYYAIKIVKPGIKASIDKDLRSLRALHGIAAFFSPRLKAMNFTSIINLLEQSLLLETNMCSEASACEEFKSNNKNRNILCPEVYWDYTTNNILVSQWIDGFKINDLEQINAQGIDSNNLMRDILDCFFNTTFIDGFLHGDMHTGNILITPNGQIAYVDFGIMSRLSIRDRYYAYNIWLALLRGDHSGAAKAHISANWIDKNVNAAEFAQVCRGISKIVHSNNPCKSKILISYLMFATKAFRMEAQSAIFLLQKNMIMIEGISQILKANMNVYTVACEILSTQESYMNSLSFKKTMADENIALGSSELLATLKNISNYYAKPNKGLPIVQLALSSTIVISALYVILNILG